MKKIINKLSGRSLIGLFLFTLLAAMILSANVHRAWAYFTTYATAKGGYTIHLGDTTTSEEKFSSWKKRVSIKNGADSEPVLVRARAFCGSEYSLDYDESGSGWSRNDDGYYYYSDVLGAGASTDELIVGIGNVPKKIAESVDFDPADFNVIVVYETVPALYDADGNPYADWSGEVDATTVTAND